MFKILMCNCNRHRSDQLDVQYTYSFMFDDCNCSSDHEFFAVECKQNCYPYNLIGFARNCFSSICCSCPDIDKNSICLHCKRLRYSLNNDTIKVCLTKENLPKEFKLMKLDNYLRKCVNADPHVFFSKEDNEIKATLDSPNLGNFFRGKKTMKNTCTFFIFGNFLIFSDYFFVHLVF